MKSETILIFDFFGVVCSEIAPFWLQRYFTVAEATKIKEDLIADADVGKISQAQLFLDLSRIAGVSPSQIEDEWMELVVIDKAVVKLIKEYKKNYCVALLTNAPSPFVRNIINKYNLDKYFDVILVSSEEGLAKPNPEFFKLLLKKIGTLPSNAIMIDDNIANIMAAKSIGLSAIHFNSAENLREELICLLH